MASLSSFGPFELQREVGHGGMGAVYLTEDGKGRTVALKIVPEHLSRNDEFRNRFLRECKTLDRLSHPGIPRLYEQGQEGGRLYLTMEYVEGRAVEWIVPNQPDRASSKWVWKILAETARILEYAHAQGVIHRDISPKNILVTDTDDVKVIDFGISKVMDEVTLTMTGQYFGTPAYMAPEQFEASGSKGVDARADLWSLGVVGFWMLARRLPFESESQITLIRKIANPNEDTPFIRDVKSGVTPGLAAVIDRLTEKDPVDRFQSAGELIAALEGAMECGVYTARPSKARKAADRRRKAIRKITKRVLWVGAAGATAIAIWMIVKPTEEAKARKLLDVGYWSEAEKAFQAAVIVNEQEGDERGLTASYLGLGRTLIELGRDLDAADTAIRRAEQLCLKRGDTKGLAEAYTLLGWSHRGRNKLPEAESFFLKAVETATKSGDDHRLSDAYLGLGCALVSMERQAEAEEYVWKAVETAKRSGSNYALADAYAGLGVVLVTLGKRSDAAAAHGTSAELFGKDGYLRKQAIQYVRVRSALGLSKRRLEDSVEAGRRAAGVYKKLGDTNATANMYASVGSMIAGMTTDDTAVENAYQDAAVIYLAHGDTDALLGLYERMRSTMIRKKRLACAESAVQKEAEIRKKREDYLTIGSMYWSLAHAHTRVGSDTGARLAYQSAERASERAVEIFEKRGDDFSLGIAYRQVGMARRQTGNETGARQAYQSAEAPFRAAVSKYESEGNLASAANAATHLGSVLQMNRKPAEAVDSYRKAAALREKLGQDQEAASIYLILGSGLAELGKSRAATEAKDKAYAAYLKAAQKFESQERKENAALLYAHLIRLLTDAGRDAEARRHAVHLSRMGTYGYREAKMVLGPAAAKYAELWAKTPKPDTAAGKGAAKDEKDEAAEE